MKMACLELQIVESIPVIGGGIDRKDVYPDSQVTLLSDPWFHGH
jgi:hypothetical protein